jgi:hypothetical protein
VPRVYDDPEKLFANEKLDFVDIITDVDTHARFVEMAASQGIKHIICQKPMAPDFATAKKMVTICKNSGARLYIHENYRWQAPVRRFKQIIDSGVIVSRSRQGNLSLRISCFDNHTFARELDHFILTDGDRIFRRMQVPVRECESLVPDEAVNHGIRRGPCCYNDGDEAECRSMLVSYASIVDTTLFQPCTSGRR